MSAALRRAAFALVGAGLAAAAGAQGTALSMSAYGTLDMAAGRFQAPGGAAAVWRADGGAMSTSYLGFKGSDDLGGGVTAHFVIEHFLRPDTGEAGRNVADALWARSAWVGLRGQFGQTRLGRNTTPMFVSTVGFNPFGDSYGFSPSIRHYYAGALLGDSAWNNSISFLTRNPRGVNFNLIAGLGEGGVAGRNLGGHMVFYDGPLGLSVAAQQVKHGTGTLPVGFVKQDSLQLGGSYDFGPAKLYVQFGDIKTEAVANLKYKLYQLGVAAPVGSGRVLASYGEARTSSPGAGSRMTLAVGYDHWLSLRTDVYGVFVNERGSGQSSGRSAAIGVRHQF